MGLALREDISFCEVGGRHVFLDVSNDRYFCLEPAAERAFRLVLAGQSPRRADRAGFENLIFCGILKESRDQGAPAPCRAPELPNSSFAEEQSPPRPLDLAHAIWRLGQARLEIKLRALEAVLYRLRSRKARILEDASEEKLRKVASAFDRLALIATPLDRCLPRSLAAAHMLMDLAIRPDFVIGVRLQPFSAHSWVQHGSALVNETLERTRNYTPILVI